MRELISARLLSWFMAGALVPSGTTTVKHRSTSASSHWMKPPGSVQGRQQAGRHVSLALPWGRTKEEGGRLPWRWSSY